MYTVRVSCKCKTCKANAEYVGAPFPPAAMIRPEAAAVLKLTNGCVTTKAHGTVHMAHHPAIGAAQRMALPVTA